MIIRYFDILYINKAGTLACCRSNNEIISRSLWISCASRFDFFTKENDRVVRLFQGNLRLKREKNIKEIIKRVDFLQNGLSL